MSLLRAVQSLRKIGSSLNLNHYWQIYLIQITCTRGRFVIRKKVSNELVLYHSYFSFTVKSLLFCRNRIQIRYFHQIWSNLGWKNIPVLWSQAKQFLNFFLLCLALYCFNFMLLRSHVTLKGSLSVRGELS